MEKNIVITIARQYGSGGRTIAQMLSERLGIHYYDKELLKLASEDSGINEDLFRNADEHVKTTQLFKIAHSVYKGELIPPESDDFTSMENLFNYQAKIIKKLAEQDESCIIVGRCAEYVLKDYSNCFNIYIYAPFEKRIENCVTQLGMEEDVAIKMIMEVDKARRKYHKKYTNYYPSDLNNRNLMIDSSFFGVEGTAQMVADIVRKHFGESETTA